MVRSIGAQSIHSIGPFNAPPLGNKFGFIYSVLSLQLHFHSPQYKAKAICVTPIQMSILRLLNVTLRNPFPRALMQAVFHIGTLLTDIKISNLADEL